MASVDVRSIGAGGGSIAWVDAGGLLRVGPQSAGADPGPACYGRGGTHATVTDAAVVLGYIDPGHFLGGRMALDEAAAQEAIARLGEALGLSLPRAAWAVFAAANENMIEAIKEITINEGVDPSEAAIVAGGGASGLNVLPIAAELGCRTVLVPRTAGALSASGMQLSDLVAEAGASRLTTTDAFDFEGVNRALGEVRARLERFAERLRRRGFSDVEFRYFVEARYRFQVWELEVPVTRDRFDGPEDVAAFVERFHRVHRRVFAVDDPGQPVECLNWRGMLAARMHGATAEPAPPAPGGRLAPDRVRRAWFGGGEPVATPVYLADKLSPGQRIDGPAIVEEPTTTIVVYPGTSARITAAGRYLLVPAPDAGAASAREEP
jgi:N-methylhydantoinase A